MEANVGTARAAVIHVGEAMNRHESIGEILDADSEQLKLLYPSSFKTTS